MKIGFLQFSPVFGNPEENLDFIEKNVEGSKSLDLLVLPELALTGYTFEGFEEAYSLSEEIGGSFSNRLVEIARRSNVAMVVGFLEREAGDLFNSSILIDGEGVKGIYRKVHLFRDEKIVFKEGNLGFPVFTVDSVKVGLLVCFDWIFPEAMRTLALKGAEVILHSSNLVLPYYQEAAVTRAIENRVFIVLANRTGMEDRFGTKNEFTGGSEVVNPDGKVVLKVGKSDVGVFMVDINPEEARNKNITEVNNIFQDRKPDLYFNQ